MTGSMVVKDDLGQNMMVARWAHSLGGRLSSPVHTFNCAFWLFQDDDRLAVNVGDTVVHEGGGRFRVEKAVWL